MSVGARLALALALVVAGALGIVYAVVVPSLERQLVSSKLDQLEASSKALARRLPADRFRWVDFVEAASASASARVVIFDVLAQEPPQLVGAEDSQGVTSQDVAEDPIALSAGINLRLQRGTAERGEERYAEVAVPVGYHTVLLLSRPLSDSLGTVHFVKRRLLLALGIALGVAILLGYVAARAFARRIRRLEQAAERIAGGSFDVPVVDRGSDEVAQLAAAFERMRVRLARLEHARREFIANASHELRTPLFALGGSLELLADEEMDEPTRQEFIATMREQVVRLAKLATELLDLSRLDAGRLAVERVPVDLGDVAADVVEEFAAVARADAHALAAVGNGEVVALGDEQRVLQIGRILVGNALLHTAPGTPVRVRVDRVGLRAALRVEDEGPGIPPEHQPHVFERFYRVDGGRASGSGLGLSIARELAALMGGNVELESRPGLTVFSLVLPAAVFSRENAPVQ